MKKLIYIIGMMAIGLLIMLSIVAQINYKEAMREVRQTDGTDSSIISVLNRYGFDSGYLNKTPKFHLKIKALFTQ